VIGDHAGVRQAVLEGLQAMLSDGVAPDEAHASTRDAANQAISSYNERIGE